MPQQENKRILIVDDNVSLHEDFRKVLLDAADPAGDKLAGAERELFGDAVPSPPSLRLDLELDFAHQGEEAFKKVLAAQAAGRPYALVFMDVRMPPGWDGVTTVGKIWEHAPLTEVVICTAYSDYSLTEITAKLGRSDRLLMLKKPFDSVEVQQMAIALTRKWNLESGLRALHAGLEETIAERTRELDLERQRGMNQAKLAALGEMAAGIAHEINTPLAIIQTYAGQLIELLGDEELDKDFLRKAAGKIETTVQHISKTVNGLRSFSRSGERDPMRPVVVAKVVEETLGFCEAKFNAHAVELKVEPIPPGLTIDARPSDLVQVLLNLFNNAFDAVEKLPVKRVTLDLVESPDHIELRVTDSGNGIPEAVLKKLFEPFFTTKGADRGTGLGLSISQRIIRGHRGELKVDRECPNTRFVIKVPRRQEESSAGDAGAKTAA